MILEYLPSKQFVKRIVVLTLVLLGWFFIFGRGSNSQKVAYNSSDLLAVESTPLAAAGDTSKFKGYVEFSEEPEKIRQEYVKTLNVAHTVFELTLLDEQSSKNIVILKKYGAEIKAALMPYQKPGRKVEPELALAALEKGNKVAAVSELTALAALRAEHEAVIAALLKISVPADAADIHLALVNTIARIAQLTENMENILEDPVRAISSAQEFAQEEKNLLANYESINKYFAGKGIMFTEGEQANLQIYDIQ